MTPRHLPVLLLASAGLASCATSNEKLIKTMFKDMPEFERLMRSDGRGFDDNVSYGEGDSFPTPIARASYYGRPDIVARLLELGVNPQGGLYHACWGESDYHSEPERLEAQHQIIRMLVERGAKPSSKPDARGIDEERCVRYAHDPALAKRERDATAAQKQAEDDERMRRVRAETEAYLEKHRSAPAAQPANEETVCEREDIKACRATGRSCEDCFYASLPPAPPKEVECIGASAGEACGAVCCTNSEVCCVSDTGTGPHCVSRNPGCVGWGRMRKYDWDRAGTSGRHLP